MRITWVSQSRSQCNLLVVLLKNGEWWRGTELGCHDAMISDWVIMRNGFQLGIVQLLINAALHQLFKQSPDLLRLSNAWKRQCNNAAGKLMNLTQFLMFKVAEYAADALVALSQSPLAAKLRCMWVSLFCSALWLLVLVALCASVVCLCCVRDELENAI